MANSATTHAQLFDEYSSAIDSSTLLAILSDYDLSATNELDAVKQTLDILREATEAESAQDFDPSGVSGSNAHSTGDANHDDDEENAHTKRLPGWRSAIDATSLCGGIDSMFLGPSDNTGRETDRSDDRGTERLSQLKLVVSGDETEEQYLVNMFPALSSFDIQWTLKKSRGDVTLAIDELMTQSFLEQSGMRRRGIEAFSEDEYRPQSGKKTKKKGIKSVQVPSNDSTLKLNVHDSKWDVAKKDISFLASKTEMPRQQISSMYHSNGASLQRTIRCIIEVHKQLELPEDPVMESSMNNLRQEFPLLSHLDLVTLLNLSSSVSNTQELARAMLSVSSEPGTPKIPISIHHVPLNLDSEYQKPKLLPQSPHMVPDMAKSSASAETYNSARDEAFLQASAAYRKSKSNYLMGGAAAYYSQVGRDFDARAKHAESSMADALADSQSSKTSLDLHGVNVKDAVRISRERVTTWWHELGDMRVGGKVVGSGYRIVTGVGNHSEGGRGKLGPAVGKMLLREGWKVQVGSGVLLVTGVVRK